jgi:hypothetical protein
MAIKSLSEILRGETRFGRLTVICEAEPQGKYRRALCQCDCGAERAVHTFSLTSGKTLSCGCYHSDIQRDVGRAVGKANRRHGRKETPEYRAWSAMKGRCLDPKHRAYRNYGARGITVCAEWVASFEAFHRAMGDRPSPDHSLDRIDNDRGYCPDNCRWATSSEQNRNRRPFKISR